MDAIAVTGAAGKTGQAVIRAVARRRVPVRALVYRDGQDETVRAAGAGEVVRGDLRDATALRALLADAVAVYHICPNVSPDEVEIGRAVLDAARQAEVGRFVFHSVLHPQAENMPHHWRKLRVEELVFASGLPFTILQPAPYMQNVLAHKSAIVDEGVLPVPYSPSARLALVDLDDMAAAAATVLTEPGHTGAIYELCGSEILGADAMAEVLGPVLGRPVTARVVDVGDWRRAARASGLDDERCDTLSAMFHYYDRHGLIGNGNVLRWLLGRPATTFESFAKRAFR